MVPMKCTKALTYAGRRLNAGDEFQARGEKDARVLVAIGKASRSAAPAPTYNTRMMTATTAASSPLALDSMDAEALHALAKERGVKVHHMAGAAKVRAAILAAQ